MPKYRKARIRNKIKNIYWGRGADKCQGCGGNHHGEVSKLEWARERKVTGIKRRRQRRDWRKASPLHKYLHIEMQRQFNEIWNQRVDKILGIRNAG